MHLQIGPSVVLAAGELKRLNSVKANKLRLLERERPGITAFTNWIEAHKVPRPALLPQLRNAAFISFSCSAVCWGVGKSCKTQTLACSRGCL